MYLHRWKQARRRRPRMGVALLAALLGAVIVMVPGVQAAHLLTHQHDHPACHESRVLHGQGCHHHAPPVEPKPDPHQHDCQTCHLIAQVRAAAILVADVPALTLGAVAPLVIEAYCAPASVAGLPTPPQRAPPAC
jgi:hypothetical protein